MAVTELAERPATNTGGKYSGYIPIIGMTPFICMGGETTAPGWTKDGVEVVVRFNNFVSLRPRKDGSTGLQFSNEQTHFGRLVKVLPRFSNVVGLDVTAEGEIITANTLMELVTAQTGEFLTAQWDATHGATAVEDL